MYVNINVNRCKYIFSKKIIFHFNGFELVCFCYWGANNALFYSNFRCWINEDFYIYF